MSTLTNQELNHLIATKVNGWTQSEGIVYLDNNDSYCYLADYCDSIPHAMDLAKQHSIGLTPDANGWTATKLLDESTSASDSLASKAIVLCLLSEEPNSEPLTDTPTES